MIVGNNIGHDDLLVGCLHIHVLWLQETRDAQLAVCNGEGVVQVACGVVLIELLVVDEVGPVLVDEGIESKAVAPAGGEVAHVDVLVVGGLDLAPEEERVLSRALLLGLVEVLAHAVRERAVCAAAGH